MADKKSIKQNIKRLQRIKTWQLAVLLIFSCFIAATFLRLNNIGMIERRDAIMAADEVGDNEVTKGRLYELQRYVSAHMNTNLGQGVFLRSSYEKAYAKVYEQAADTGNRNSEVYQKAFDVCAPRFTHYSLAFTECITSELAKYPAANDLQDEVTPPPQTAYWHSFTSPLWSPDFAGWSVLVSLAILLMIIARLVSLAILRILLRRHNPSI